MILKEFSQSRAKKLIKLTIPPSEKPIAIEILWQQYEDFNCLSEFFNNKLHKHAFYELHFILEGKGIITDSERKEYPVNSGQAIVVPKDIPHAFEYKNEKLKRFSIAFTLPESVIKTVLFSDFATMTLRGADIERLNTIFAESDKNTSLARYVIRNRLTEIIYEILNLENYFDMTVDPPSKRTNLYIDKSKKYINDNLNIILSCKDVADYCHINEIHLNRLYKKHVGEPLHKYIRRKKIEYSIELLKRKELSLATISTMLGFPNEYYFNAYFKRAVGLPPGTYRNMK